MSPQITSVVHIFEISGEHDVVPGSDSKVSNFTSHLMIANCALYQLCSGAFFLSFNYDQEESQQISFQDELNVPGVPFARETETEASETQGKLIWTSLKEVLSQS